MASKRPTQTTALRIRYEFNDELLRSYLSRGAQPLFKIWWEFDGAQYPDNHWFDFGSVIVGWWLVQVRDLLQSRRHIECHFMEGDYALKVARIGKSERLAITPPEKEFRWVVTTTEFVAALRDVATEIETKLRSLGVNKTVTATLTEGLKLLDAPLVKLQIPRRSRRRSEKRDRT
jgi:hypothetical protein